MLHVSALIFTGIIATSISDLINLSLQAMEWASKEGVVSVNSSGDTYATATVREVCIKKSYRVCTEFLTQECWLNLILTPYLASLTH